MTFVTLTSIGGGADCGSVFSWHPTNNGEVTNKIVLTVKGRKFVRGETWRIRLSDLKERLACVRSS